MSDPILLIVAEDEVLVAQLNQETLEEAGYTILVATDGDAALRLIDENIERLAGLVTDIRLGTGPTGWELARHARTLNDHLAVVYTSGDSGAEWSAEGVPSSVYVQKPYAPAQLVAAISGLLNTSG